ncbi:MAG TPA: 2-oxoglutarate dehydrogenase complex dihydrolipoyllysine-residue succinyltransferase [Lacipirellulaceae bacterium]|nr:2-oxoglutarate dehydrogenase complex dihydrolipoyllysine-residue succinyltransferase [Lacipirellulaceae bacterium]
MSVELKIPDVGESIREVQIGRWLKHEGELVARDESVVELETDKASMELPAPAAGVLEKILKHEGEMVGVGEIIGYVGTDGKAKGKEPEHKEAAAPSPDAEALQSRAREGADRHHEPSKPVSGVPVTPAARRALREHGLSASDVEAEGPSLRQDDVLRYIEEHKIEEPQKVAASRVPELLEPEHAVEQADGELEEIVPMSLIRRRIAERLVDAQHQAALLTTFNEIEMSAVKALRAEYRDEFQAKYGVKLGFMSFFVKAVIDALKLQPALNAEIRDGQIVYRRYYHIGVAVSSTKGLVVPVLRFAERLSFAEIEQAIDDFGRRAASNKLEPRDLEGGTFTISNGGVFGSLLSTPIVNPPQSGVLGMHAIQDRPVAREGQVVIRPMMYVALTYDHRLIDGREAVLFLRRVKDAIEDPARMLLEV